MVLLDCVSISEQGRLRASPFFWREKGGYSVRLDTACIFVDGENLRHSISELLGADFDPGDYLPKNAEWEKIFDHFVKQTGASLRLRTYWYVVDQIDFWPFRIPMNDPVLLEKVVRGFKPFNIELGTIDPALKRVRVYEIANELRRRRREIKSRFDDWRAFQEGIEEHCNFVEFRREGSIRCNLFTQKLEIERSVAVKLATDLLEMRSIYDVAIIVSGDAVYVPAVKAVKDSGKRVVNVAIRTRNNRLLPGGARRLNLAADSAIEIDYAATRDFMKIESPRTFGPAPAKAPIA
jgi:uncharacterized LabA/DUF88 family protein